MVWLYGCQKVTLDSTKETTQISCADVVILFPRHCLFFLLHTASAIMFFLHHLCYFIYSTLPYLFCFVYSTLLQLFCLLHKIIASIILFTPHCLS